MANISTVAPYAGAERTERPGILRRILTALIEARQEQADREIAAITARQGDLLPGEVRERRAQARQRYPFGQDR